MHRFWYKVLVMLFLFFLLGRTSTTAANNILVVSSYGVDYQWSNAIIDGINAQVKSSYPTMELNIEYLYSERFGEPQSWINRMNAFLSNYEKELPLAIVLISDEAWMAYCDANTEKFRNVPLFLCGVKPHTISTKEFTENYKSVTLSNFTSTLEVMKQHNATGILREMNIEGYVDLMKKVMPELDRIMLITDSRFYGIYTKLLFQEYMRMLYPDTPLVSIDARHQNTDSLLAALPDVTPTTAILLTSWLTGEHGFAYSKEYVYKQITTQMKTPVFITNDIGLDKGNFLGGYFNHAQFWGDKTGEQLLRVLSGTPIDSVATQLFRDKECYINWEVLNSFKIPEEVLPANVFFVGRPVSVFMKYRNTLLFALFVFILILISYLYTLRSNIKLKQAQKVTLELMDNIKSVNDQLYEAREELVKALFKAENEDRMKSAFVANMGNEIRNPLNAIVGFAGFIATVDTMQEREEAAEQIKQNSDKLLSLVSSILDLSRIESGEAGFNYDEFSGESVCRDLLNVFKERCHTGVTMSINVPQDNHAAILTSDSYRISQALKALLDNAVKFTNSGHIELGYFMCDDNIHVEFYVKDTGEGIPEGKTDEIFDHFVKLNKYGSGSGLGLTLARSIIKIMGGEIGVSSRLGEGSRFWFRIKQNMK